MALCSPSESKDFKNMALAFLKITNEYFIIFSHVSSRIHSLVRLWSFGRNTTEVMLCAYVILLGGAQF
jgi:hypothetical protein